MSLKDTFEDILAQQPGTRHFYAPAEHDLAHRGQTRPQGALANAAPPRNVGTAIEKIDEVQRIIGLAAGQIEQHISRLLGGELEPEPIATTAFSTAKLNEPARMPDGQVETLHKQIDSLTARVTKLGDLVQRLGEV